jgi:cytochrome c-type biogenesis protein CcmH/NrfF
VACGLLGLLRVLGFWLIPLGLLVLSIDIHIVRRWRRQLALWWHRDKKSDEADVPTATLARKPKGQGDFGVE